MVRKWKKLALGFIFALSGVININANVVHITSGGQIFTTAFSCGNAGNIELNVSDRLNISGSNPGKVDIFNQIAKTSDRTQAEFQLGSANLEAGIFCQYFTQLDRSGR